MRDSIPRWLDMVSSAGMVTGLWVTGLLGVSFLQGGSRRLSISPCPRALVVFGDSLWDTGNLAAKFPHLAPDSPYGETYFRHPSGRYSDGRLLVDFFAQAMQLPLLSPFLKSAGSDYRHGVNFAVAGSTATNFSAVNPFDLTVQYGWFQEFKQNGADGRVAGPGTEVIQDPLYVISIGSNDYTYAHLYIRMALQEILSLLVPAVVGSIRAVAQNLLGGGARHLMVFNIPPEGCSALILTVFPGSPSDYDEKGCLTLHNSIAQAHNAMLRDAVNSLRHQYPDATILYADYYSLAYDVLSNPKRYGFGKANLTHACCGLGGNYNFNIAVRCGQTGFLDGKTVQVKACTNPQDFVQWDGFHFTEAFNKVASKTFLAGKFSTDTPHNTGYAFACPTKK